MITFMRDDYWNSFLPAAAKRYAPWLRDRGSLTRRIQQRCSEFAVRNVCSHLASAGRDETALLGQPSRQLIYTREVVLYADGVPVVFAHSVVAAHHLRGAWHALQNLGSRPLGALLFAHPLVERAPLRYKLLKPREPLGCRAATVLGTTFGNLWARRSLFTLHGAPLLVTEVFLPGILELVRER
jgi:chorismate--pyruvate lyase